jgi:hypothetical protein
MKRILIIAFSAIAMSGLFSSCLKDKGFEDQNYGIQVKEIKGVAFPLAPGSPLIGSINSDAAPQEFQLPNITLEQAGVAATDVTVTISLNNALVDEANTAVPSPNLTVLPADAYTVSTLSVVIPKGSKFSDVFKMSILNSTLLNPLLTYAVGFSITGVSDGYTIAANQKDIVVGFAIKNIYDGIYSVESGLVTRYTAPGVPAGDALSGSLAGNPDIALITAGATTLSVPVPATGAKTFYWAAGTGSQVAGIDNVRISVDPNTNLVTVTSLGNGTLTNWAGKENSYDPVNKIFKLAFRWNPTANVREYEVVLKYKGPR